MVAAVTTQASQSTVLAAGAGAAVTPTSQLLVLVAGSYPANSVDQSQMVVTAATAADVTIETAQMTVLVAAIGRVQEPNVRAWTFTLDEHDFYVLRLPAETLVYDVFAKQWYVWGADTGEIWQAFCGANWQGGNAWAYTYGSNVLVGDDGVGSLYFLDPENAYDDDPNEGADVPRSFERIVTGQVATRSSDMIPCFGVQLSGSIGEAIEAALTTVTLYTSDDQGHTYDEHDTITIENGEYSARVEWWSLGSFAAPGRLFKVTDTGALHRIDYLEMLDPPKKGP